MKTILIAGANGMIARHLSGYFSAGGWRVVGLARREAGIHPGCRYVNWDGKTLGDWTRELEAADVLVNLAGKSVNCRFTPENRRRIMDSRVGSTRLLGEAVAACSNPPEVWINAGGANIYCGSREHAHGEDGDHGEGFMADVCEAWERGVFQADVPAGVRRIVLRTSMVLADEPGNPLRIFRRLASLGMAGRVGDGKQMVSWIHIDDVCRAVAWLVENGAISGPVNMTSPEPLPNADFMRRFRDASPVPAGLPAAAWMVRTGAFFLRIEPRLILDSLWVIPNKLLNGGFEFKHPELRPGEW